MSVKTDLPALAATKIRSTASLPPGFPISARDGRIIEQIGTYDPSKGIYAAQINEKLAIKWLNNGAIPSDSVRTMLARKGIMTRFAESKKKASK